MELDPARAGIEHRDRLADRILREVEAHEWDQPAVRALGERERPVVSRPKAGVPVGLVEAEHEAARDAVLVHPALEVLVDARPSRRCRCRDGCAHRRCRRRRAAPCAAPRPTPPSASGHAASAVVHASESMQRSALRGRRQRQCVRIRAVPDVLIYGDTVRSPELRHEVPVVDPGRVPLRGEGRAAASSSSTRSRSRACARRLRSWRSSRSSSSARTSSSRQGKQGWEIQLELALRACRSSASRARSCLRRFPSDMPTTCARTASSSPSTAISSTTAAARRTRPSCAGIRNAQKACEAALDASRDLLRRAEPNGAGLEVDGEPLTSERIKRVIEDVFADHEVEGSDMIVAHGPQIGRRPRHGLRPDRAERADRVRPLPEGQGDGLLFGHDAHVRRRRAVGRGEGVVPAGQGSARHVDCGSQARRERDARCTSRSATSSTAPATRRS